MSDRLLNLLIQYQLPLDKPGTSLQGEVERVGEWLRIHLERNPSETFRFEPLDNRLIADSAGVSRMLVPEISQILNQLNTFFHTNSAVSRDNFSRETISQRILHPASQKQIVELIQLDKMHTLSELGGVVIADHENNMMQFFVIESDNVQWVNRLQNSSDYTVFASTLRSILPSLPFLKVRAERTLDILHNPEAGADLKQQAVESFMELLTFYSKYSYILEQGTQYAAIAHLGITGIYMGLFHVHPPDNTPSMEDKAGSVLRKNFVLVPKDQIIEVHYLDFSGHLSDDPLVIQIRQNQK